MSVVGRSSHQWWRGRSSLGAVLGPGDPVSVGAAGGADSTVVVVVTVVLGVGLVVVVVVGAVVVTDVVVVERDGLSPPPLPASSMRP